ncbi:ribonuclease CAF1 [Linderina pennispora]|uniref:Ribonuclease CAF1 n=1 Tax=Linderina pennispora TaxID=61395 RepID=A0A1Y1WGQ8_9FUNG|nr:ribonuclease CAF1 [Linderina pennispora]ORX72740.1 ribonuclease CAF1 [Linderina pennispora]
MDVTRENFRGALRELSAAVTTCDFVAIDMEMTGLYPDSQSKPFRMDTKDERYQKLKKSVEMFGVVQVGICLFTWIDCASEDSDGGSQGSGGYYEARPFNFNVFPCTNVSGIPVSTHFSCQNTAFEFLAKNSFDFNKWVHQGIMYLRGDDIARVRKEKLDQINNKQTMTIIDEQGQQFMAESGWIYGAVGQHDNLSTRSNHRSIEISKVTKKDMARMQGRQIEALNRRISSARGFCEIIDKLSAARKPVIGHNMPLDILHMFSKFHKQLPDTRAEFEKELGKFMPVLIDTKYIIESTPAIKAKYETSNLDEIAPKLERESRSQGLIRNHPRFTRDMSGSLHEAGCDAYLTGSTFIRLLKPEGSLNLPTGRDSVTHTSELVMYHYINKLVTPPPTSAAVHSSKKRPIANDSSSGNVDNDGDSDAGDRSSPELAVR